MPSPNASRSLARLAGLGVLALAAPTAAHAGTIAPVCNANITWSIASHWAGGLVPGPADTVARPPTCNSHQLLTIDPSAPDLLGHIISGALLGTGNANRLHVALGQDTTFSGKIHLREGEIRDGGYDLTVADTLSNCSRTKCDYLDGEGNGLILTRTGGNIDANTVYLHRSSSANFRPGDRVGNFTLACLSQRNACPTPSVTQDTVYYGNTDEGLTVTGALTLGILPLYKSTLALNWNTTGVSGAVDWTLRVYGNQVAALQTAHFKQQLIIGTVPDGKVFDRNTNIFYAADGYTYVGFVGVTDSDNDGVPDSTDACPGQDDRIDPDGDGVPSACDMCPGDPNNDVDGDGECGDVDNCPVTTNEDQADGDDDGYGDLCDVCTGDDDVGDWDGDGYCDDVDAFPLDAAYYSDADADGVADQLDQCEGYDDGDNSDLDLFPDDCDLCPLDDENDADLDEVCESGDNCDDIPNTDQVDYDNDTQGDSCDDDIDGDALVNEEDCEPTNHLYGATLQWYRDTDGDHFGDLRTSPVADCDSQVPPAGYVLDGTDCDDDAVDSHPDGTEVCDSRDADEDCDGSADDYDDTASGKTAWYADLDGDGIGVSATSTTACNQPDGYVVAGGDCNDTKATAYPGATEICSDGVDNDCDGATDEGCTPQVAGYTTTTNSDGTYTLSSSSGILVTLPTGTTASGDEAITTRTDTFGNQTITFSGFDLPAGAKKSITVTFEGSRSTEEGPQRFLNGRQTKAYVYYYRYQAASCIVDSATLPAVTAPANCPGLLYWASTWEQVTATRTLRDGIWIQSVGQRGLSNLERRLPQVSGSSTSSDGKSSLAASVALRPSDTYGGTGGTVRYTLASKIQSVAIKADGQTFKASFFPVSSASLEVSGLSHTSVVVFADDDGDGLVNAEELELYGTDPNAADSDGDGVYDAMEVAMSTDPSDASSVGNPDADADLLDYVQELLSGTDPDLADTDGDGVDDGTELADGTDPTDTDDSLFEDLDGDGTDDRLQDDDDDGLDNGSEAGLGTDPLEPDSDGDGVSDLAEFLIYQTDPLDSTSVETYDTDGDGFDDDLDTCIEVYDVEQFDTDGDSLGDACDDDDDNDGVGDSDDAFPANANETTDTDGDGTGDNGDAFPADPLESGDADSDGIGNNNDPCFGLDNVDSDGDAMCDDADACPADPANDIDSDGVCGDLDACVGDGAVPDSDGDQVCEDRDICLGNDVTGDHDDDRLCDGNDNCPVAANADQTDLDGDGGGDACDDDDDGDGASDGLDTCPGTFNADQANSDSDGLGDACDDDDDGDGVADDEDNCPLYGASASQADFDADGLGDACDGDDDADAVADAGDVCPATPLSVLVNGSGCSGSQYVAYEVGACSVYKNKGQYQSAVAKASTAAKNAGLLTDKQRAVIVSDAAKNGCR